MLMLGLTVLYVHKDVRQDFRDAHLVFRSCGMSAMERDSSQGDASQVLTKAI